MHSEQAQFTFRALHHVVVIVVLNGSGFCFLVIQWGGDYSQAWALGSCRDPCAGMNRN